MAGPNLPENNDLTYPDIPNRPAYKQHKQDHDALAKNANKYDTTNVATAGFVPIGNGTSLLTRLLVPTDISGYTESVQDTVAAFLVAGTNITLTYNDTANTLTVTGTGAGGSTDPEIVRDTIGTALVAGANTSITVSDVGDTITVAATRPPMTFSAGVAVTGITGSYYAYAARTLTGARMSVVTAPVGSALAVDLQHWNGSTWATISTLTISAGSTTDATSSFTQAQAVGNKLRANITSVGSTTAATGVVIDVLAT